MRVCLLKIQPWKRDLEGNFGKLMTMLSRTADAGVDVFVTPECYLDGYVAVEEDVTNESLPGYGITVEDSAYVRRLSDFSRSAKAWVVFGCVENTPKGPFNSALVFDRDGNLTGRYRKVHLQKHDRKFQAGDALPVFESDFGKFGVMICADRRWPETVRTLALRGARVIFNPTYGMHGCDNECMMRTRSYESEVFICFSHPVESLITNPRGRTEAHLVSSVDGALLHDIDPALADDARKSDSGHLKDRVVGVYE